MKEISRSVFRFTQKKVNKSPPKRIVTGVISHLVNSGFSFLSSQKTTFFFFFSTIGPNSEALWPFLNVVQASKKRNNSGCGAAGCKANIFSSSLGQHED